MKTERIALIGAVIIGAVLSAETKPAEPKISPEIKTKLAILNSKLLSARLEEERAKQQIQINAQKQVDEARKRREADESAYQQELNAILKPLNLLGCRVNIDAEIVDCPKPEPEQTNK